MILTRLSLALAGLSLVTAAAIPSSSSALEQVNSSKNLASSSPDVSWSTAAASASWNDDDDSHHIKRNALYVPEAIPDDHDSTEREIAMREAGFIASDHHDKIRDSSASSSANADAHARLLPIRDLMSELDRLEATESVWEMIPSILPPFRFFVVASSIIAIITVIRGCCRRARH